MIDIRGRGSHLGKGRCATGTYDRALTEVRPKCYHMIVHKPATLYCTPQNCVWQDLSLRCVFKYLVIFFYFYFYIYLFFFFPFRSLL